MAKSKEQKEPKKEIKLPKIPPKIANMRFLVENYYDIQDNRIRAENRNRAWFQVYKIADNEKEVYQEAVTQKFKDIEQWLYKQIEKEVKKHPLWDGWLKDVKGIGPALAGGLIAWIADISKFETISALNAYAGYACDEKGDAIKRKKGTKINWNPTLKKQLWKATESFVKSKGKYREFYDKEKIKYKKKYPKEVKDGNYTKYTKGHIHNMALRKTRKLFVSHLWLRWREIENLTTRSPWVIEYGGHTTYIPPFTDAKPKKAKKKSK